MQCQWLFTVISVASIALQVNSECTEEQLNKAQMMFKDCMDEKKATLLQTDVSEDEGHDFICSGLMDLSTGCKEPVTQFAVCRGREFVDNLLAIHLNALTGGLYSLLHIVVHELLILRCDVTACRFTINIYIFPKHHKYIFFLSFRGTCAILPSC